MSEPKKIFTYEEALETFPLVQQLTRDTVQQVESLFQSVASREELETREAELTAASQAHVDAWVEQMESLGCVVKGLWLVDFDSGSGYYCWRYPEESLGHFHGYEEGFAGRIPIH